MTSFKTCGCGYIHTCSGSAYMNTCVHIVPVVDVNAICAVYYNCVYRELSLRATCSTIIRGIHTKYVI
jgi:hypothetical protein